MVDIALQRAFYIHNHFSVHFLNSRRPVEWTEVISSESSQGELTFESDSLVEGGCLDQMHNGTNYREVREFRSTHHRVRFYFVTRVFSRYMSSVLEDLRADAPDVVLVNSCIWDISRWEDHP